MSGRSGRVVVVSVVVLALLGTGRLEEPASSSASAAGEPGAVAGPPAADALLPVGLLADPAVPEPPAEDTAVAPPPTGGFGEAPPPPAPAPRQLRGGFQGVVAGEGTWAVIVGANDYPGSEYDLESAVADADDVDQALARFGVPAGQRLVLRDGQASAATLRSAVDWLVANAGPDAVAVLFYAGHVRKLAPASEALVGSDGGLLADAELASRLSRLQARRMWIGIAGCYGGGFTELRAPGRVLTAAAGADDLAYENDRLGRSYLVEYMVRRGMIQNLAAATVQTAFLFARAEITRDFPRRVPVMVDLVGVGLDLRPPGTAAPAPAPAPAAAPGPPPGEGGAGGSPGGGGSPAPPRRCLLGLLC